MELKSNFTHPGQSMRLIEAGLPEWTADCRMDKIDGTIIVDLPHVEYMSDRDIPCWSVGRLMEIYLSALFVENKIISLWSDEDFTEQLVYRITKNKDFLDFSKLNKQHDTITK